MSLSLWARDPGLDEAQPPAVVAQLLQLPQNVMRLAMLVLTGLILVWVTYRTRRLVDRAIVETVQRIALTRYLPPQLADRMAQIDDRKLRKGTLQQAAVLFVDIRGFTTLAEGMAPASLGSLPIVVSQALLDAAGARGGADAGWIALQELHIRGRSGRMQAFARA